MAGFKSIILQKDGTNQFTSIVVDTPIVVQGTSLSDVKAKTQIAIKDHLIYLANNLDSVEFQQENYA